MSWQILIAVKETVRAAAQHSLDGIDRNMFSLAMLVIDRSSVKADNTLSLEALEIEQYLFTNSD